MRALTFGLLVLLAALPLRAAPKSGKIAGVVVDPDGTPQLGASVLISSEELLGASPVELFTNGRGQFTAAMLPSGFYSVKVTLAGFLPSIEQHIQVTDERTILVQIVLGSLFSSLDKMRHDPAQQVPSDEWNWVLRTSAATRPVLRYSEDQLAYEAAQIEHENSGFQPGEGRLDLTSGSDHPGSVSNLADSPSTAFAYDWQLGAHGQLLMAGQFSYDGATPAGGFATVWVPSGNLNEGSVTSLLVRESRVGGDGPSFHGARLAHDSQFAVGERVSIRYGAEFLMADLGGGTTESVRPRAEVAVRIAEGWMASASVSSRPWQDSASAPNGLQTAINSLDMLPTLLLSNGRPVLEGGLHEEIAIEHALSKKSDIAAAVFHDYSGQTAVFGRGAISGPDFLTDPYENVFAYDAGVSSSTGFRVAYCRSVNDNLKFTVLYAYGGALAYNPVSGAESLRDQLSTRYRQSLGGRATATIPRTHTKIATSYKWINGQVVSHQDLYGESMYRIDPYLSLEVRQPLPSFIPGHGVALVDVGNLLAQGYVPLATGDGNIVLVAAYRYVRGGFSFQF
jgi:hypothetical protein